MINELFQLNTIADLLEAIIPEGTSKINLDNEYIDCITPN